MRALAADLIGGLVLYVNYARGMRSRQTHAQSSRRAVYAREAAAFMRMHTHGECVRRHIGIRKLHAQLAIHTHAQTAPEML